VRGTLAGFADATAARWSGESTRRIWSSINVRDLLSSPRAASTSSIWRTIGASSVERSMSAVSSCSALSRRSIPAWSAGLACSKMSLMRRLWSTESDRRFCTVSSFHHLNPCA
jgi:hypothetical protein